MPVITDWPLRCAHQDRKPEREPQGQEITKMGVDLDAALETLRTCQFLPEFTIKQICEIVRNILIEECNIQPVFSPVNVCGDIHGQFWDLLELFKVGGDLPDTNYIFMVGRFRFNQEETEM
jgi:hypothetical protein